ncbi:DUF485 domain-containing protein [Actinomadura rubrisoli]|uniref:DUF485 domain-containing protein n=1 Tax=Actinomadura rubrisoli TaxID=2530368 RepID=UPI001A9F9EFB
MVWDSRPSQRRGTERDRRVPPGHFAPVACDERFLLLRRRFLRVALGIVVVFLGWYLAYVALSAFARGFMARTVAGNVNVGLLLGVLQFVSTFLLAWLYAVYARRRLDPLAAELRAEADAAPVRRVASEPSAAGRAPAEPSAAGRVTAESAAAGGAVEARRAAAEAAGAEHAARGRMAVERRDVWPGAVRPDLGGLR